MNPEVHEGDTIQIIRMVDPYSNYEGRTGIVRHIDDMGFLHGTWGGLAILPSEDEYIVLKRKSN